MTKKFIFIFFTSYCLLALGIFLHLLPENGFQFLQHPQSASWLLGMCVSMVPVAFLVIVQWLKTHHSFVTSKARITSILAKHQKTKEMNSEKSLFLATISHEIRNPLQAIMGTHELLLKDHQLKPESAKLIQNAHQTTKSLLEILNQVLDVSKIEAGKAPLHLESTDLASLIRHTTHALRPLMNAQLVEMKVFIDPDLAPSLLIDQLRLKQVLVNLISNAIKFTGKGAIFISVHVLSDTHTDQSLQIQIIDTGCGIAKEDMARITEPYERTNYAKVQAIPGSGLGLSISNQLLRSMGSSLHIESTQHLGTCISMRLVCKRSSKLPKKEIPRTAMTQNPTPLPSYVGKKVLIVDDYPACQEIIAQQCQYLGFETILARHALDALDQIQNQAIDVVISDELMPDLSGTQLAKKIQHIAPQIKVIIITGDHLFHEKHADEIDNIDAYLIKPVFIGDLIHTLEEIFSSNAVLWSLQSLLEYTQADETAAHAILESIRLTQEEIKDQLSRALHQEDWSEVAHLSHKAISGATLIRAQSLITLCHASSIAEAACLKSHVTQIIEVLRKINSQIKHFLKTHSPVMHN